MGTYGIETNTKNYLGNYDPQIGYSKFDYVYNTEDRCFYYAKEDIDPEGGYDSTSNFKFSIDADGPLYGGKKTAYLYDHENNIGKSLRESSKITVTSYSDTDEIIDSGTFYIKRLNESYNPALVAPRSLLITDILDAQENNFNQFSSSWLFGGSNFEWLGRDWARYVSMNQETLDLYEQNVADGGSLTLNEWAFDHYNNYGAAEGRSIPLRTNHQLINLKDVGCSIFASIDADGANKDNITQDQKNIWFNFVDGVENLYFHASKNRSSSDNSFTSDIRYRDSTPKEWHNTWTRENPDYLYENLSWGLYRNIFISPDKKRAVLVKSNLSGVEFWWYDDNRQEPSWFNSTRYNAYDVDEPLVISAISEDCENIVLSAFPTSYIAPRVWDSWKGNRPAQWPFSGWSKRYYEINNLQSDWGQGDVVRVYTKMEAEVIAVYNSYNMENSEKVIGRIGFEDIDGGYLYNDDIYWIQEPDPIGQGEKSPWFYRLRYEAKIIWVDNTNLEVVDPNYPDYFGNSPELQDVPSSWRSWKTIPRYEQIKEIVGSDQPDIELQKYLSINYDSVYKFLANQSQNTGTDIIETWQKWYPCTFSGGSYQPKGYSQEGVPRNESHA
ncbi:MAG: hypothetical protein EBY39_10690 [Flavobacteriia bacterium]|nr:hypothetical protein [Flavobacteriia bacterium]